jgi:hypothetical protein
VLRTARWVSIGLVGLSGCGLMLDLDPNAEDGGAPTVDSGPRIDSGRTRMDAAMRDDGAVAREGGPGPVADADRPVSSDASPIPTTDAGGPTWIDGPAAGTGHFGDGCMMDTDCASGRCRTYDYPPWCWYTACTASCGDDGECEALLAPLGLRGSVCYLGECDLTGLMLGMEYCE